MLAEQEARIYDLYARTDDARLAAERKAKEWRGIADALAMVLRKNGVGGRQFNSALALYDEATNYGQPSAPQVDIDLERPSPTEPCQYHLDSKTEPCPNCGKEPVAIEVPKVKP